MATGLDGLLFTLTTTLIVARILAFPTQIDLPNNEYMVEDLGLYSGTKPKPSSFNVIPICTVFTINSTLISFYMFGTFPTRIFYWTRIS
jgi:hypothetical protein